MTKKIIRASLSKTVVASILNDPTYAVVDVGSGAIKVNFYSVTDTGALVRNKTIEGTDFNAKLAEGMTGDGDVISPASQLRGEHALLSIQALLKKYKIQPSNTCVVATAALRAVRDSQAGQHAIQLLSYALGDYPIQIISGEEEAILVGETIKRGFTPAIQTLVTRHGGCAFAAIGGGSTEFGIIGGDGRIENPIAIPYGIHTLRAIKDEHKRKTVGAGASFQKGLNEALPEGSHPVLCVMGGNWRGLGGILCPGDLPSIIRGSHIRSQLLSATHRTQEYYERHGPKIAHRSEFMGLSAAMLRRVAKHVNAKALVFIDGRIGDTLAEAMFQRQTQVDFKPLLPDLGRLFGPLAPSRVPHA